MIRDDRAPSSAEPDELRHASFVLRCWPDGDGGIRVRLIDARSGVSHPLARVSELPGLLQGILERLMPSGSDTEIDPEEEGGDTRRGARRTH